MARQIKAIDFLSAVMRIEQWLGNTQILQQVLLQSESRIIKLPS